MYTFFQRLRIDWAFFRIAGSDKLIDYRDWRKALDLKNDLLLKRMFKLVDADNSSYIDKYEFRTFAKNLLKRDNRERLKFVFQLCDVSDSGRVEKSDLETVIRSSLAEQGLKLSDERIAALVDDFINAANKGRKSVDEESFVSYLANTPGTEAQFAGFTQALLQLKSKNSKPVENGINFFSRCFKSFFFHAKARFWALLYIVANVLLFVNAMHAYAEQGATLAVQIARGGGACLNFNGALVLLPMCRFLLTRLRHTFLFRVLPLDELTDIHKHVAYAIIFFGCIHTAAHLYNYYATGQAYSQVLLQTLVGVTGVVLCTVLWLMWRGYKNKNRKHEFFSWSHLLYAVFIIALLYHGPVYWLWLAPIFCLFAIDSLWRTLFQYRRVDITELRPLSDQVTQVRFKRGKLFKFHPGDYVKIKIPAVSNSQWHPFTLSAAPESNRFDLHIRNNGDWSGALHNLANQQHPKRKKWRAYLDGPYGAPTSSIYRSPIAVLIAGGIGVTPFSSVLQSILLREKNSDHKQILHFHWLNRSQHSYSWFIDLLQKAEAQLGKDRFQLHIHLTSLSRNLSNLILQIAFDEHKRQNQKDAITDLRAKTSAGRPNWDKVFANLCNQYMGAPIDIYFCGPGALGHSIRQAAYRFGFRYREEKFE